jgi:PAS domain S-box-containing protein
MGVYPTFLALSALVAAIGAGFLLAQSPRQRATQLASLLAGGAAWWALCESFWNAAPDAQTALHWMRLATPGYAFILGLLPHASARYFDSYAPREFSREKRRLLRAAVFGYLVGGALLSVAWVPGAIHRDLVRVPWGWTYTPGPAQLAFFLSVGWPITLTFATTLKAFRSSLSVALPSHRRLMLLGMAIPLHLICITDVALPVLGIHFPRLGSSSYAIFGLLALGAAARFGFTFLTPRDFSDEILDTLHEGVALITRAGVIRRANRDLVLLSGRTETELVGVPLRQVLDWEGADDLRGLDDSPGKLFAAGGEAIPVSVSTAPLRDDAGSAMGLVVVVRDLREIEEMRRRMLTQARLAAVGELAAGLAHEINNPLAFVRSNLGQLERHWKSLGEADALPPAERSEILGEGREIIGESLAGVDRAAEIVRGVRRFTHAGHPAREPADLNELLEDTIGMVVPRVRSSELSIELSSGAVAPVHCAPQELRQVFLNLLMNAVDAISGRGRVQVTTRQEHDWAIVEVRDDGCGIAPETLERIFDPFFTTKRVGEGTGLGLGIAWNVVDAHGGRIEVDSAPGHGSTFRVRLPIRGEGRDRG